MVIPEVLYDGRANFATNPFNGPMPTYAQVSAGLCSTNNVPGCVRRDVPQELPPDDYVVSYSHQASVGVQRQLGPVMALESNFVFTGTRADQIVRNMNLTYNPATGANYPFSDISPRPFQKWEAVNGRLTRGYGNYRAVESSLTKRFRDGWQATATYTLGWDYDSQGPVCAYTPNAAGRAECQFVSFPLQHDVGDDYGPAAGDQRHRMVLNGIWGVGYGFQLSGMYLFGSGERRSTT